MAKIDEIKMLRLGQRDENLARSLAFDCSDWLEQYPEASIHILFRRPGESAIVPMSTTLEGTTLTWLIHDYEVGKTGIGNAEFRAVDTAGLRRKSRIIPCSIEETLLGDDETVLYTQDQVDETLAHISEAAQAALAAKASEEAAALSASEAGESAASADTAADVAVSAKDAAQAAQTAAETAQHQAEAAQSGVHADAEAAEQAKVAAQAAQANAQGAASQASADRTAAESARADAEAAATHAEAVVEGIDQAGADQVAAVNAAGQAQVTAVNQAGTTQVGNVNAAGTTQVNAVQAKGTQVIASIPADYSQMSTDVTDLKSALSDRVAVDAFQNGWLKSYNSIGVWEQGLINPSTGVNSPSSAALHAYAIRTKTYIDTNAVIAFIKHLNQNFRFSVFKYQSDGTFVESVSKQTELTPSAEYKYRLVMLHYSTVSLSNYMAITPAEYNEAGIFSDRNELAADVDTIFYHPVNVVNVDSHYYTTKDGVLHCGYVNDFSCTNMIAVNPGDKMRITTACGDAVGVVGYGADKSRLSNIMETGGTALYQVGRGVLTTEITIPADVYFITVSNVLASETDIIVETSNMKSDEVNPIVNLLIVPDTSERFLVYDRAENGKYLKHRFVKQYYTDTLSYGGGSSKTVVGADVWYSDLISDGAVSVMAGNFNFIHNISNMKGHNGYVGAGHGCTVADWIIFKADGKLFDPTVTTKMTTCTEFDFIIKAKNYLIDKPNSPSESHAVPTLDENGDPIVTSINTINARIKTNNEIEYRNRLIFKMDGIQFRECHGSMCEGYFSAFDNVIVSNSEESWNYLDSENDYAREKMNGTQWDIFAVGSKKALSVVMFGNKYKVENKLIQMDGIRNKITNTRSEIYRTGGNRMKIYLMPVVCTISAENIADGATVETFNTGDIIDCMSYRKISVSD